MGTIPMDDRRQHPPLGALHEYDGRRLMLHRSGVEGPAVVFLPGAGLIGYDFLNLHREVGRITTSVLYDRGGTGWSDPVDLPRTPTDVAEELRSLLHAAGVPGPYILVGHSLGAFYARRYAQLHLEETAGLVLLDPGHEDIMSFMPPQAAELNDQMTSGLDELPDLTAEQVQQAREQYAEIYSSWPEEVRGPLIEEHLRSWRTQIAETKNFETTVYDELRAGGPLSDIPLIVLTAGGANPYWANFMTDAQMREALDGVRRMQASIAESVPRGEQRVLEGASHQYLHIEREDAVIRAIRDVVGR
ncbi:alpha/beta fold hydrolase [Microbacterium sp. K22]|nr:alpha/beta hydrolase [Microbacterium sp. K22]